VACGEGNIIKIVLDIEDVKRKVCLPSLKKRKQEKSFTGDMKQTKNSSCTICFSISIE
jgi:hypothetical protein